MSWGTPPSIRFDLLEVLEMSQKHRLDALRGLRALVLAAALLLLPVAAVQAQGVQGQLRTVTITEPGPDNATGADPFRTSNQFSVVKFTHDGASGSYFINSTGADINGSSFIGSSSQTSGEVMVGFNQETAHNVGVVVFQTRINVTVQSQQNPTIFYDKSPPTFTVQTIAFEGGEDTTTGQTFSSGTTYYTNKDSFTLTGQVQDQPTGGGCTSDLVEFAYTGTSAPAPFNGADDNTFTGTINLDQRDGEYLIDLTAKDSFTGGNDDATSQPNVSLPLRIRVVRDTVPPAIEKVEIIKNPGTATQTIQTAGPDVFVGPGTIQIRVTMSEKMESPPRLTVQQANGVEIQTSILTNATVDDRIFTFQYSVIGAETQNGPAQVSITGAYDGPGGEADFGHDLAKNPIQDTDPLRTIAQAFKVDTIAPDLIRFENPDDPASVVSVPKDGSKVGRASFPDIMRVYVDDYDSTDRTVLTKDNASGVDFSNLNQVASGGSSAPTSGISIVLQGPNGQVQGTLSVSPPNGIFLQLPDWRDPSLNLPNFTDVDGDGEADPVEGTWTIRVGVSDRVGNGATHTIIFTVDTTPVNAGDVEVLLTPAPTSGNPLPQTGTCVGQLLLGGKDAGGGTFPSITATVRSTWSPARSTLEFLSQVDGTNSVPVKFDSDAPTVDTTSVTITNLRRPGLPAATDDWPRPNDPVPAQYVPVGYLDPRIGQFDGKYLIRFTPSDDVGNKGVRRAGVNVPYLDYEITLDTIDPYTAWTFPPANGAINVPLRNADAVIVDPVSPFNGNEGCGVDTAATEIEMFLERSYQPNAFDQSYLELAQNPGDAVDGRRIRTVLKFIHDPNNFDPTIPSFNPDDDTYRVLVEIVDSNNVVRSLKDDGTMDGIYSIAVDPVDKGGNDLTDTVLRQGVQNPGTYYGLNPSAVSTRNLVKFFFLLDTVPPEMVVQDFPDGSNIGGAAFTIKGDTIDLSARQDADGASRQGGAGIDRVTYRLQVVDENGVPIQNVAAAEDPNNPGEYFPQKTNPVIDWTKANLAAIRNLGAGNGDYGTDPVRTTTRPMDAAFAESPRERRSWTILGQLPDVDHLLKPRQMRNPNNPADGPQTATAKDYYRLAIRSYDRAGNYTEVLRRVVINLDTLRPPILVSPACGTHLNKRTLTFKWNAAQGAVKYAFQYLDPQGNQFDRTITGQELLLTLSKEGTYRWRVASIDAAGNQGAYGDWCDLHIDLTPPRLIAWSFRDPVQDQPRTGVQNLGQFELLLTFDETLDTTKKLGVTFDPIGSVGAGAQTVTTSTFTGANWSGTATIPTDAVPKDWDGTASLYIKGATDLAGNTLGQADSMRTFEIDTGPYFETRFFVSPFKDDELMLIVRATEALNAAPTLTFEQGLSFLNAQTASFHQVHGQPGLYYITLKLQSTLASAVTLKLSGTDLDGNTANRTLTFDIVRPSRDSAGTSAMTADGTMALVVPRQANAALGTIYLFPPTAAAGEQAMSSSLTAAGVPAGQTGGALDGELVAVSDLHDVQPHGLAFDQPATVRAKVDALPEGVRASQVGIYAWYRDRWQLLPGGVADGWVQGRTAALTPMKVAADVVPPKVEARDFADGDLLSSSKPELRLRVTDGGSGVGKDGLRLTVDGKAVDFDFDEATGELFWKASAELAPGSHDIALTAVDRSGNQATGFAAAVTTPAGFGFEHAVMPYPNPARSQTMLRCRLTQVTETDSILLRVYDGAGRLVFKESRDVNPAPGAVITADPVQDFRWDLVNMRGRRVAQGVYFYRLRPKHRDGSWGPQVEGKIAVLR